MIQKYYNILVKTVILVIGTFVEHVHVVSEQL